MQSQPRTSSASDFQVLIWILLAPFGIACAGGVHERHVQGSDSEEVVVTVAPLTESECRSQTVEAVGARSQSPGEPIARTVHLSRGIDLPITDFSLPRLPGFGRVVTLGSLQAGEESPSVSLQAPVFAMGRRTQLSAVLPHVDSGNGLLLLVRTSARASWVESEAIEFERGFARQREALENDLRVCPGALTGYRAYLREEQGSSLLGVLEALEGCGCSPRPRPVNSVLSYLYGGPDLGIVRVSVDGVDPSKTMGELVAEGDFALELQTQTSHGELACDQIGHPCDTGRPLAGAHLAVALRRQAPRVSGCERKVRDQFPTSHGQISLAFSVSGGGRLADVSADTESDEERVFASCVVDVLTEHARVHPSLEGRRVASYPFSW